MAPQVTSGRDRWIAVRGLHLHVREWTGAGLPFVLLHGLASNCRTWEAVARYLNAAGHPVITVDQRGHGLSDKPETGYEFEEVTADLKALLHKLEFAQRPILAGQSWGGNVVLDFAVRYPDAACGIVLVDGGFIELSARPGATWEKISVELRPPNLLGTPRSVLAARFREWHPGWSDEGIENSLANFETLPDGTVRPWLTLDRHMQILRALWEHHPSQLYARVKVPVLICPADTGDTQRSNRKRQAVKQAEECLSRCRVHWFEATAHDIHVHRPEALAQVMLQTLEDGFFRPC